MHKIIVIPAKKPVFMVTTSGEEIQAFRPTVVAPSGFISQAQSWQGFFPCISGSGSDKQKRKVEITLGHGVNVRLRRVPHRSRGSTANSQGGFGCTN